MALAAGSKLGPYEVLSLLGAGGMGEVYRARDTRLGREVAIKVLPAERMADENRRRRFVQEARAASALNHPNIVTIHEIESADEIDFIVMEYVPGKTLDALIPRQGMRLGEALRVAIPVADALARAHASGIIHRDIKPANVMVGDEGVVKVLDFGLAKLVAQEEASDDQETTMTRDAEPHALSRPGAIAGTPGYMSPEQATGGKVDARSDVFAFGSMLYEMVTGRRAFVGNSAAETLTAVVRAQPKAPSEVVPGVPRDLEKLILRCLRKEPDRRFQHMSDVKVELLEVKEESNSGAVSSSAPVGRNPWPWLGSAVVGALILAAAAWFFKRPREAQPLPPRVVSLTSLPGVEITPTFSPDGNQVAFAWQGEKLDNWDIWLKMIGSSEMRRLTTDPAVDYSPSWSPDGRLIAFCRHAEGDARATIHLVSPLGGSNRKLGDLPVSTAGLGTWWSGGQLSWSPDGQWLVAGRDRAKDETAPEAGGLHLIPVQGGASRPITAPKAPGYDIAPALSTDGHRLAYASCSNAEAWVQCHLFVVELGADLAPKGAARSLTQQPETISGITWARDGQSVIYDSLLGLWRIGVEGGHSPERVEIAGRATRPATALSRDRLVFVQHEWDTDIYRFDAGRPSRVVLASSLSDHNPNLSPDGRRVAFESQRSGEGNEIWLAEADGSNPVQLTHGPGLLQGTPRWSPDGRRIAFDSQGEDKHYDIWTIDVDGGSLRHLTQDPGDKVTPSWSADGRSIYFSSDREGSFDIWRVASAGGPAERVTRTGGHLPYESADGQTLFFKKSYFASPLLALALPGGPERQVVDCVPWFGFAVSRAGVYHFGCGTGPDVPLFLLDAVTGRDRLLGRVESPDEGLTVSPDGKTILYTRRVREGSDLMMIENFR